MPLGIQLSGIHPRSEKLIDLTRSYERAKTSWSQVEVQLAQETRELIELQKKLGFSYLSDGAVSWQDQLRPVARSLKGVEFGTRYSRWFDTNTFYQKPVITGNILVDDVSVENFLRPELLAEKRDRKITLPGPYTFSQLSENKHYRDSASLVLDVVRAEREIFRRLWKEGVQLFQLSEPCLVYQPYREDFRNDSEIDFALKAIRTAIEGSPGEFVVQTYFGDAAPLLPRLLSLPIRGIGIDLFETDISTVHAKASKSFELGIVDSRESFVEDPSWIADTARKFCDKIGIHDVVFAPNSDLKFVPQTIANQKIEALSKASHLFEEDP